MNRIDATFARLARAGRMGLFPYLMAGFPTREATVPLVRAAIAAGADGIELGVPFSDPLADGATIQHAGEVALRNGASLAWTLEVLAELRRELDAPLVPMTYYNPLHRYGVPRFVADAVAAGADGVIVPDLPSGEAGRLMDAATAAGLYVIQLVAPTTNDERLAEVGRTARGFVYCVSLLGTTGARSEVSDRVPGLMQRVRAHVGVPLLLGFGIARPEHVRAVRPYADAVVVGAAIADLLAKAPAAERETELGTYLRSLRQACDASVGDVSVTPA